MRSLLFLALFALSAHAHQEGPSDRTMVRFKATPAIKDYLRAKEIDVTGVDIPTGTVDALLTAPQMAELEGLKAAFEYRLPQSLLRAPDPEYMNPDEVEARLRDYAARFPELTQLREVGRSLEGRPIWAIKISDHASQRERAEPTLLFNGMHHAREVMTPEVTMDIVDYLLTRYNGDEKVRAWVDSNEIWVLPMFNVDGNNKMWTRDSMWRKNVRDGHGVDVNRNYPGTFNSCNGSSGMTWSQTYRGKEAASEPETRAMMAFVQDIRPVFNISYHSYSELVIYPHGCRPKRSANAALVESIGKEMASRLGYTAGTSWETLYNVDGGDIDWMHMEAQVIPYVIEVNSSAQGFHPDYARWRDVTVEKNRVGWQLLLDRVQASGIRGSLDTAIRSQVEIDVADAAGRAVLTYKVNPDGTYHIVLAPGRYQLTFRNGAEVLGRTETLVGTGLASVNRQF